MPPPEITRCATCDRRHELWSDMVVTEKEINGMVHWVTTEGRPLCPKTSLVMFRERGGVQPGVGRRR